MIRGKFQSEVDEYTEDLNWDAGMSSGYTWVCFYNDDGPSSMSIRGSREEMVREFTALRRESGITDG